MRKFLLLISSVVAGFFGTANADNLIDVISLAKFTDYTPGANKWFTNMEFGSGAKYSGHIKIAADESGLVFDKKSDGFYVETPIEDARIKSITLTFLTDGELEVYSSNTRKLSMSGSGEGVVKNVITKSFPMLTFTDDMSYFVVRNPGNEFIVSMVTILWEKKSLIADVEVPTLYVDDNEYDPATPLDLGGVAKRISFSHNTPEATIYYLWEADGEGGLPLFTPYTEPFEITKPGTLSYNCEVGGQESDVVELKVIGMSVEQNAITEIGAESAATEWFNLQGMKVENPGRGVWLMRSAGKTIKVMKK